MFRKPLLLAIAMLFSGRVVLTGQQPEPPRVFTSAQAETGRVTYENTCGRCHTLSMRGRSGAAGELPPLDSLPDFYQEFIARAKHVPPLAGKEFLSKWGDKTVAQVIARFQVTAGDSWFQFKNMDDESVVNITAYALQVSGAKPGSQPLTRTTNVVVNSLIP